MTKFNQCKLVHYTGATDTVWIDSSHAIENHPIERKINGSWESGWTVAEVHEPAIDYEIVKNNQNNYKTHRKGTDI